MTEHVTMQDGTEQDLTDHLGDTHRKGTRGLTDAFLNKMHRALHLEEGSEAPPEHQHPDIQPDSDEETQPAG